MNINIQHLNSSVPIGSPSVQWTVSKILSVACACRGKTLSIEKTLNLQLQPLPFMFYLGMTIFGHFTNRLIDNSSNRLTGQSRRKKQIETWECAVLFWDFLSSTLVCIISRILVVTDILTAMQSFRSSYTNLHLVLSYEHVHRTLFPAKRSRWRAFRRMSSTHVV